MNVYVGVCVGLCCLKTQRPPRATLTDTLFPDTTLFLSPQHDLIGLVVHRHGLALAPRHAIEAPHRHKVVQEQGLVARRLQPVPYRSEEHTSELQSLMRISYALICLKQKTKNSTHTNNVLYISPN